MKKKRITYGVYGMMQYQTDVYVGKSKVRIEFEDGSTTAYGVIPAQFTTDNIMIQFAIEASADFKKGKIKRIKTDILNEELVVGRNTVVDEHKEETVETKEATVAKADGVTETEERNPTEEDQKPEATEEGENVGVEYLEFEGNNEAREYLVKRFGISSTKVRTRAEIIEFGKAYGLDIAFV